VPTSMINIRCITRFVIVVKYIKFKKHTEKVSKVANDIQIPRIWQ